MPYLCHVFVVVFLMFNKVRIKRILMLELELLAVFTPSPSVPTPSPTPRPAGILSS